jgi:hypothetical protein
MEFMLVLTEDTHGARPVHFARPQAVTADSPLAETLLAVLIHERPSTCSTGM